MGTDPDHEHAGPVADASVRVARPSDAPAVGLVQAVVFTQAYAAHLPSEVVEHFAPRAFTHAWRDSLEHPPSRDHVLLVACAGMQVVGFAAVGPSADPDAMSTAVDPMGDEAAHPTAALLVLGVHPQARRQGHGSRLLNAVVDTARARGNRALTTWVLADDRATRAFLTAAGLGVDGAHRERVVGVDGATLAEVRLGAALDADPVLTPEDA